MKKVIALIIESGDVDELSKKINERGNKRKYQQITGSNPGLDYPYNLIRTMTLQVDKFKGKYILTRHFPKLWLPL